MGWREGRKREREIGEEEERARASRNNEQQEIQNTVDGEGVK